jgi:hypothetical protein
MATMSPGFFTVSRGGETTGVCRLLEREQEAHFFEKEGINSAGRPSVQFEAMERLTVRIARCPSRACHILAEMAKRDGRVEGTDGDREGETEINQR